ncbi:MAG TPA: hypothetical protein P5079_11315 [Elusimicrobiota bacterium]|nr:hypothetical protein [Elusimicrobiota bacterium]
MKISRFFTCLLLIIFCTVPNIYPADDIQSQFENSWNFYSNRVKQGASEAERLSILDRIEKKYEGQGIDLAFVKTEKGKLLGAKEKEAAEIAQRKDEFYYEWGKWKKETAPHWSAEVQYGQLNYFDRKYGDIPEVKEKIQLEKERLQGPTNTPMQAPAPPIQSMETSAPQDNRLQLSPKVFGQIDYWLKDSAFEEEEKALKDVTGELIVLGYDASSANYSISNGLGIRGGLLFPVGDGTFHIGGSVGYIWGPTWESETNGYSWSYGNGRSEREDTVNYLRFLLEAKKAIPLNNDVDFVFRGGLGLASGRMETTITNSGTFVTALGASTSSSQSETWSGFTWEFLPSLLIKGNGVNIEFGVGFAQFPTLKETEDFYEFEWAPIGFRAAVEF